MCCPGFVFDFGASRARGSFCGLVALSLCQRTTSQCDVLARSVFVSGVREIQTDSLLLGALFRVLLLLSAFHLRRFLFFFSIRFIFGGGVCIASLIKSRSLTLLLFSCFAANRARLNRGKAVLVFDALERCRLRYMMGRFRGNVRRNGCGGRGGDLFPTPHSSGWVSRSMEVSPFSPLLRFPA